MSPKTTPPDARPDARRSPEPANEEPANEEPGTNAVDPEPDPHAKPIPDGQHKYIPRSPYTRQ